MSTYLEQLNEAQRNAVIATDGPIMIIAGAGSGKTRVLTYRIAHLIELGIDPFQILSLTFTKKAASEMKSRIAGIVGRSDAAGLWMGTFHSVFARILRKEGHHLGYPSNFTIYDTEDSRKTLESIIREMNLDKDIYKVRTVQNKISHYKNNMITPKVYNRSGEWQAADEAARMPMMGQIYSTYTERCFRAGAMDFDDLLLKTNELLYRFPDVCADYQQRFKYIMVDEYQDTNHSQYLIVKILAALHHNICVVGDDAQSIYSFRGANIRNILNFKQDYPEAKTFKLEQNYRSTQNIVNAANSVISFNKKQLEKSVWTGNEEGEKITVHKTVSDSDEGNYVAKTAFEIHQQHRISWKDFAILFRTNSQSRAFEDALRKRNIPYRIYGGVSFYQRKEVKDLLAYYRLAVNHRDEESFRRVINLPARGIGDTTLARMINAANDAGITLWQVAEQILNLNTGINKPTCQRIANFVELVKSFGVMATKSPAFEAAEYIARTSGLVKLVAEDKTPEGVSKHENLDELLNGIKDYSDHQLEVEDGDTSLSGFLQDIALLTEADRDKPEDNDKVQLMTIHQSKGLEFPYVFVVGMEENLFPSMMTVNSRDDLEEERRLFYVALTRAEKKAYLTYAQVRFRWGKITDCEPSRFIDEIDEQYLDIPVTEIHSSHPYPKEMEDAFGPSGRNAVSRGDINFGGKPKVEMSPRPYRKTQPTIPPRRNQNLKPVQSLSGESDSNKQIELHVGTRVIHNRFGIGTVKELTGSGPDRKASIQFDNAGMKKLLLNYAKLQLARGQN